jgi:hypothetical protein
MVYSSYYDRDPSRPGPEGRAIGGTTVSTRGGSAYSRKGFLKSPFSLRNPRLYELAHRDKTTATVSREETGSTPATSVESSVGSTKLD